MLDQPAPTRPTQVWVSNLPYLPLASGPWAYRCAFPDACTRQVVGWRGLATLPDERVTRAWQQALLARQPAPGLLVPADRGGPYCANAYRALLDQHGGLRSQSRRDECHDNAPAERRWAHLKTEEGAARVARVAWPGGRAAEGADVF